MLVPVDAAFGMRADLIVTQLRKAFPSLSPFVAPVEAPDPGLAAVLELCPTVAVEPGTVAPTPWFADLGLKRIALGDEDVIDVVGKALELTPKAPPARKPLRVPPLEAGALGPPLSALGDAWGVEVTGGNGQGGLRVELVASFRCSTYAGAADLAHAVAVLAEAQNHHPTLIHDWRTVTVRVATGEAGQRLTDRDLRFAAAVNRLAASSTT